MTHTYSILSVPAPIFDEIKHLLREAGYSHVLHEVLEGEVLDMHGIALGPDEAPSFIGWHKCDYKAEGEQSMPAPDNLILIRILLSSGENYFLGKYFKQGVFLIQTKAELQNDGSHLKLTSSMHADLVTHWAYITEPK